MNRKHFLSSVFGGLAISRIPVRENKLEGNQNRRTWTVPNYLAPGDLIGICCPAGYITLEEIQPSMSQIESWGFKIRIGQTVGKKDFTFGGTDEERMKDMQQMLDDPAIKAILCGRGGYGTIRIIDQLDFTRFAMHPKWIIGFSDITVIHAHLSKNYEIASLHSKMCNSFPDDWSQAEPIQIETILSIKKALSGEMMNYNIVPHPLNKTGIAEGALVGGNLKTIDSLAGSKSDMATAGNILFVEDTGEYLYSIDRMFWSLKRTGKLDQLKGLIIGGFKINPDDPGDEFSKDLYTIVLEKLRDYHYPVCFDFPVGHQKNNYALKCGVQHRLDVGMETVRLAEIRN
jgi:muramoyltetrapeptide carboxypeptidase